MEDGQQKSSLFDLLPDAVFAFVLQPLLAPADLIRLALSSKAMAQAASPRLLCMLRYTVDCAWPKRCMGMIQKRESKKHELEQEERYEKRQQAIAAKKKPLTLAVPGAVMGAVLGGAAFGPVGAVMGAAAMGALGSKVDAPEERKKKRRPLPAAPKDCGSTPCIPKFHNQRLLENQRRVDGVERKGGGDGSYYRCIHCGNAAICNESTYILVVLNKWTMTQLLEICGERWLRPLPKYKTRESRDEYTQIAKATWTRYHMDQITLICALHVKVLKQLTLDAVPPQSTLNDNTKALLSVLIRDDVKEAGRKRFGRSLEL